MGLPWSERERIFRLSAGIRSSAMDMLAAALWTRWSVPTWMLDFLEALAELYPHL